MESRSRSRCRSAPPPLRRPPFRPGVNTKCQLVFGNRILASIIMALPFVLCFTLFGIFNLIAGSVLTAMAWKPRHLSQQNTPFWESFVKEHSLRLDSLLDPLKIIGPILLITGAMLILVGFALGITACRSVHVQRSSVRDQGNYSAIHITSSNGPPSFAAPSPWSLGGTTLYRQAPAVPEHSPVRAASNKTRVTIEVHVPPVTSCSLQYRQQQQDTTAKEAAGSRTTDHRVVVIRDQGCVCSSSKYPSACEPVTNKRVLNRKGVAFVSCETSLVEANERTSNGCVPNECVEPGTSGCAVPVRSTEEIFKCQSQNNGTKNELSSSSSYEVGDIFETSRSVQEITQ